MKKWFSVLTVVVLSFCLTIPAFAYSYNGREYSEKYQDKDGNVDTLVNLYADEGGYLYHYLYQLGGVNVMLHTDKECIIKDGRLTAKEFTTIVEYSYNGYWMEGGTTSLQAGASYGSANVINWSATPLLTDTGEVYREGDPNFIPPPLAEMVLKLTEEELVTVTIPNLVGALKILVPCGVGCLALLVALKLFGKRSLIFRS